MGGGTFPHLGHDACRSARLTLMPHTHGGGHHRDPQDRDRAVCVYSSNRRSDLAGLQEAVRAQDGLYATALYVSRDGAWSVDSDYKWSDD